MGPADCFQPDVNDELEVTQNLNEIVLKTRDNIVNKINEGKPEDLLWYHPIVYGIKGLKQEVPVKNLPPYYYQSIVLCDDICF